MKYNGPENYYIEHLEVYMMKTWTIENFCLERALGADLVQSPAHSRTN